MKICKFSLNSSQSSLFTHTFDSLGIEQIYLRSDHENWKAAVYQAQINHSKNTRKFSLFSETQFFFISIQYFTFSHNNNYTCLKDFFNTFLFSFTSRCKVAQLKAKNCSSACMSWRIYVCNHINSVFFDFFLSLFNVVNWSLYTYITKMTGNLYKKRKN